MKGEFTVRSQWTLALLSLVLVFGGCTIVWHTTSPEILLKTADHQRDENVLAYRLTYYSSHLRQDVYEKAEAKFRMSIETAVERAGFHLEPEDSARRLLVVQIRERLPTGAAPHEFLSGLTLGVIPTWTTREGTFEFVLGVCEKDRGIARHQYLVNTKTFNWILVLPVIWINFFTWNDVCNFLEQAIEALLSEEAMTAVQADLLPLGDPPVQCL